MFPSVFNTLPLVCSMQEVGDKLTEGAAVGAGNLPTVGASDTEGGADGAADSSQLSVQGRSKLYLSS